MTMPKSGIILFDKPEGISSQAAVTRVKKLIGARSAGHTGTLDPIATGLLIICFGRATRAAQYLTGCDKSYRAVLKTGAETDTCDITGRVAGTSDVRPGADGIRALLPGFTGAQLQSPPAFSAIRINGKRAYELARSGEAVIPRAREVFIHSIELVGSDAQRSLFTLDITCSKGTYIRSLCRDIARAAGSLGTMAALRRTAAGMFNVEAALTRGELERRVLAGDNSFILGTDTVFCGLPALYVDDGAALMIKNGADVPSARITRGNTAENERYRVYTQDGELIAVCVYADEKLACEKSFCEV